MLEGDSMSFIPYYLRIPHTKELSRDPPDSEPEVSLPSVFFAENRKNTYRRFFIYRKPFIFRLPGT